VHASQGSLLPPDDDVPPELDPLLLVPLFPHASIAVHDDAPTMHDRVSALKLAQFASQLGGVASHFVVIAEQTSAHDVVAPPDDVVVPLLPLDDVPAPVVSELHAADAMESEASERAITTLRASMAAGLTHRGDDASRRDHHPRFRALTPRGVRTRSRLGGP
jgi:hypothetical protein